MCVGGVCEGIPFFLSFFLFVLPIYFIFDFFFYLLLVLDVSCGVCVCEWNVLFDDVDVNYLSFYIVMSIDLYKESKINAY